MTGLCVHRVYRRLRIAYSRGVCDTLRELLPTRLSKELQRHQTTLRAHGINKPQQLSPWGHALFNHSLWNCRMQVRQFFFCFLETIYKFSPRKWTEFVQQG